MTPRALINSVHQWLEEEGKTVEVVERNGDGKGDRSSCQEGQLQVLGMKTWSSVTFLVPLLGMLHTSVYIAEPWASWRQGLCTGCFYACIFPFSMVCSTQEGERMLSFTSHWKTSDWAMCSQEKDLSMEGWKHRGARCWMRPQLASHLSGTASLTRLCRTCPPARVLATAEAENLGRKWETVLEPSWDVLLNLRKHPSPPWLPGNDLCDSVLFLLASWDWGISGVGTLPRSQLWQIWAAVDSATCELKLQSAWVHLRSVADTRGGLLPHITHNVSLLPEDAWGGLML